MISNGRTEIKLTAEVTPKTFTAADPGYQVA
jgi:hypothetical protein